MKIHGETLRTLTSSLVSLVVILPALWFVMKPLISDALAEDIEQTVKQEIQPLNSAFVALLEANVANVRRRISRLEYKRDHPPPGDYTEQDADDLVNLQIELTSSAAALNALRQGT